MTSMKQTTMTGRADLLGKELSEARLRGLNTLLKGSITVLAAAVSIKGTSQEDSSLYVEVVAKGYEYHPFELSLPLIGSKAGESLNKALFDAFNGEDQSILANLRSYFRSIADIAVFGEDVPA